MSNTSSSHVITVTDNGTIKKLTKDAEGLNSGLEKSASTARKMSGAVPAAARARNSEPSVPAAARQRTTGGQDAQDSGMARGVGGLTGAAGRDFAKQSEGLGGLVRVYATFAANIFAATAAFGALSRAADTSNLVKGLDQLGAASGRNLGSLAKQLVATADGAISLKDALTATAQASAGGMSNANILKMGEVAKKASQALGRDMPDALNRITRGITKLEPELLDEIGIMVRLDDATREYGKSIGKSALALTDFERRQAFANAVLDQGQRKFGNISLDANPYSKILASFQNLMQTGLELVNKVLGPIMSMLSESPVALSIAIAGIIGMLSKQAIPAVSGWKRGLDSAAKSARDAAIAANALRKSTFSEEGQEAAANRDTATKNATVALEKLKKSRKAFADAAQFDMDKVTEADIANLKKVAAEQAKIDGAKKDLSENTLQRHAREQAMAAQAVTSLQVRAKESARLAAIEDEEDKRRDTSVKARLKQMFSLDGASQRIADKAIAKSQSADIINSAVNDAAAKPYLKTLGDMYAAIGNARKGQDSLGKSFEAGHKSMGLFNAGLTAVKGTVLVTAGAISTLAASLGNVFAAIGIFVTIYQILDSYLSNSAKEAANFTSAMDTLNSSMENVSRTIDFINKKDSVNIISIESTQARATALYELTDAAKTATTSFSKLIAAWGTWDKIGDAFWDSFGRGSADKLSANLAGTIVKAFEAIETGPVKEAGIRAIESITKVKGVTDLKAINEQLRKLSDSEAAMAAMEITRALDEMSKAATKNAANLTAFQASLKETSDLSKTMIASLRATDNESKLGSSLVDSAVTLKEALKDPIEGFKAIKALAKDTSALSLIPGERAEDLAKYSKELDTIAAGLADSQKAADSARVALEKYNKALASPGTAGHTAYYEAVANKPREEENLKRAGESLSKYTERMNAAVEKFKEIGNDVFKNGIDRMSKGLQTAMAEAAVSFNKTVSSIIKSAGGNTAESDTQLRAQELNIQKSLIEATYAQSKNAMVLAVTLEETNLLMERASLEKTLSGATSDRVISTTLEAIAKVNKTLKDVEGKSKILKASDKEAMAIAKDPNSALYDAAQGLKGYFAELFGKNGKLAQIMSQTASNELQGRVNVIKEQTADASKGLDTATSSISTTKSNIEARQALLGIFSEELELKRQSAEEDLRALDFTRKQLKHTEDYRSALEVLNTIKSRGDNNPQVIDARNAAERAYIAMQKNSAQFEKERATAALVNTSKLIKGREELEKLDSERNSKKLQDIFAIATIGLDTQQAEINHRKAMGTIDEKAAVLETASLANAKASIEYANQLLGLESAKMALKFMERKVDEAFARGDPLEGVMDEYIAASDALQRQLEIINAGHRAKLVSIENTKKQGVEEARVSKELKDQGIVLSNLGDITKTLADSFDDVGTSIAGVISGIALMTTTLIESGNKQKAIQDQLAKDREKYAPSDNDGMQDRLEKAKQLAAIEKKASSDTVKLALADSAKVAGIAKSMFKEKTVAHKVFGATEKALHVARLAMMIKEAVVAVTTTAPVVASNTAKAASGGVTAIIDAMKGLPTPFNFIAGAAMAAYVASLLGSAFSKGAPATPAGFDAESYQKVQGTGAQYAADGTLVSNGGGKLGDMTAVSTTIVDGLERLEKVNFEMLDFDKGNTYRALLSIRNNTAQFVKALLASGITSGNSSFGTTTGNSQAFFGFSKTSVEVMDKGILLAGKLGDIMSGGGSRNLYENVKTKSSSLFGLISDTNYNTNTRGIDSQASKYITDIMKDFNSIIIESAKEIGYSTESIGDNLKNFQVNIRASAMGLTGEEFADKIMSLLGIEMDKAAKLVFPNLEWVSGRFQKLGESTSDLILRMVEGAKTVVLGFTSIGKTLPTIMATIPVTKTVRNSEFDSYNPSDMDNFTPSGKPIRPPPEYINVQVMEKMALKPGEIGLLVEQLVGSWDNFVSMAGDYSSAFVTAEEQMAQTKLALTERFVELKVAMPQTREGFKQLIDGFKITDEATLETFLGILDLSKAMDKLYPATRKVLGIEEKRSALLSQQIDIYKAEGKSILALYETRKEELAQMDESLVLGQLYLYALEDEADVKSKLVAAYDKEKKAIDGTIKSLDASIKTLNTYKQSLLIGNQSVLTPVEKYRQTKLEAERVAALASGVLAADASATAIQAKNDAINQLPTVSAAFLDASRTIFASSQAYTQDFTWVQGILESTSTALEQQLNDAELQLQKLTDQETALKLVVANTDTIATLTAQLLDATTNVQTAAAAASIPTVGLEIGAMDMSSVAAAFTKLFEPYIALVTKLSLTPNGTLPPDVATIMPVTDRATTLSATAANADSIGQLATTLTAINNNVITLQQQNEAQAQAVVAATYDTTDTLLESNGATTWKFSKNRFDFELA